MMDLDPGASLGGQDHCANGIFHFWNLILFNNCNELKVSFWELERNYPSVCVNQKVYNSKRTSHSLTVVAFFCKFHTKNGFKAILINLPLANQRYLVHPLSLPGEPNEPKVHWIMAQGTSRAHAYILRGGGGRGGISLIFCHYGNIRIKNNIRVV